MLKLPVFLSSIMGLSDCRQAYCQTASTLQGVRLVRRLAIRLAGIVVDFYLLLFLANNGVLAQNGDSLQTKTPV